MSRSVWLECSKCSATSDSLTLSSAEKIFRKLWATRAVLAAFSATDEWDLGTLRSHDAPNVGDAATFILDHHDHHVFLHDEYGGCATLDGDGRCERGSLGFGASS